MNECQRLFLVQAKSAYSVFELLQDETQLHHCHALHYLQMATELLGKAYAWKSGTPTKSHRAFVGFLRSLTSNSKAQKKLGYAGQYENWTNTLRKLFPLAEQLQNLAPALAGDGPNPEYPWPTTVPTNAPVEYEFPLWDDLKTDTYGRQLLRLIEYLFEVAEEYM